MTLYKHTFAVTVISSVYSPDTIIRWLEAAAPEAVAHDTRITAEANPAVRCATPYMCVTDPPRYTGDLEDRRAIAAWQAALDAWVDTLPTIDTFEAEGLA